MELAGRQVLILGYGLEGQATYQYLKKFYPSCLVSIADKDEEIEITDEVRGGLNGCYLGENWLDSLEDAEVIIRSPGISLALIKQNLNNRTPFPLLTSATNIFLEKHSRRTIGITATKGKSTTSSLIYEVLLAAGYDVTLLGNIGKPALASFEETPDYFVYELSSYQLQDLEVAPHISLYLNIFPEHLDHHGSLENYQNAKSNLINKQIEGDLSIIHSTLLNTLHAPKSKIVLYDDSYFKIRAHEILRNDATDLGSVVFDLNQSKLRGVGNLNNVLAVFSLAKELNIDLSLVSHVISNFEPLPHRLELVSQFNGLTFINDSISTVPQATLNAMSAYQGEVSVLILGGFDRGLDYDELSENIILSKISLVCLFKPSGERIHTSIKNTAAKNNFSPPKCCYVNSMEDVMNEIVKNRISSGVCLLSPASPSYGLFKNFEVRGEMFRKAVKSFAEHRQE